MPRSTKRTATGKPTSPALARLTGGLAMFFLVIASCVQAQNYTTTAIISATNGLWSSPGAWTGGIAPAQYGGSDVTLSFTNATSSTSFYTTNDYSGAFWLNQITNLDGSAGNVFFYAKSGLTPAASLLFTNSSAGVLPAIITGTHGSFFYIPVILGTNLTIDATSGSVVFTSPNGIISDSTPAGIIKTNAGALTLRCANTYRGATVINGGTLTLYSTSSSINNSSLISIAAGATFDVSAYTSAFALSTTNTIAASGTATPATIKGGPSGTINFGSQAVTLNYDGSHPALTISQGSLVLSNNAFTVNGTTLAAGDYTIIANTGTGTITTNGSAFTVTGTAIGSGQTGTITVSVSTVTLSVSGIPSGLVLAQSDPRYGLGYLVVTYYPGVTNNGTGDCRAGIQSAIDDAFAANLNFQYYGINRPLAVFFPPGTYQISDILECYQWEPTNVTQLVPGHHVLIGSTEGTVRPKIVLAAGASNYQSSAAPRQMISFRKFLGGSSSGPAYPSPSVPVPDPMSAPAGYVDFAPNLFWDELRNLDFDCNGNPGAVGVTMAGCQWNAIENVKVIATGAFAGFCALPGAGSCCANIEVEGGQYGIIHGKYSDLGINVAGSSAPTIAGLKLQNQTVQAMKVYDAISPITVVGFQITNSKSVVAMPGTWNLLSGSLTLLDGQIGIGGGTNMVAIDNSVNIYGNNGKNLYVRNVYVTGTTNLIKSKNTTTTGNGTWSLIKEYSYQNTYNNPNVPPNTNYVVGDANFESYSLINGTIQDWTVPFPISPNIVTNSAAPPGDLVGRHLWASFPFYNGATNDPATVVVSTNAGWNNSNDDTVALQTAINQAATNNGRVFLPAGQYYITNTLTLYTNTVLMGVGWQMSKIQANPLWQPTTGEVTMIQTVDDANAKTTLAWLTVTPRKTTTGIPVETNYSRFNALNWRAGGNSLVLGAEMEELYSLYNNTQPRSLIKYTGNGGGKWYTMSLSGQSAWSEGNRGFRKLMITNTIQPLWFYGFNIEDDDVAYTGGDMLVQITGASNVRMLGWKREGRNPMLVVSNSTNIACYSAGAMFSTPSGGSYFQVLGSSTNILLANLDVEQILAAPQLSNTMLYEALTGQPTNTILYPNMVSLYKRGELNDAAMFVTVNTPPLIASPVVVGGNLVLTGTGGLPGGTYRMFTSTNVALPSSSWIPIQTNIFGVDGGFSNTVPMSPSFSQSFYRISVP